MDLKSKNLTLDELNALTLSLPTTINKPDSLSLYEEELREAYRHIGQSISANSEIDRKIKEGIFASHILSAEHGLRHLQECSEAGVLGPGNIESIINEIREHFCRAGCLSERTELTNGARIEAHTASAKTMLSQLENPSMCYTSDTIANKVLRILTHREALGQPIQSGSEDYNHLWDSAGCACRLSGIGENRINWVHRQIENWFAQKEKRTKEILDLHRIHATKLVINRDYKRSHGKWYRPIKSHRKILIFN